MTTFIGFDLSLTGAGVAVLSAGQEPRVGVFRSKPNGTTLEARGRRLTDQAAACVEFALADGSEGDYRVAIEAPLYGAKHSQGSQHDRAHLWWSVVDRFIGVNPIAEIAPTSVKLFGFGKGAAPAGADSKTLMMARAAQEFPGVDFIDDNGCDALWLAAMAQTKVEKDTPVVELFAYRTRALQSFSWN